MNNKLYNLVFGGLLLIGLYFNISPLIYFLTVMVFIEGLSGYMIAAWLGDFPVSFLNSAPPKPFRKPRPKLFEITSDRIWRLLVGTIMLVSYGFFYHQLWFLPWFLGFAIFGAGVSGVCPMLAAIRSTGIK